MTFCDWRDLKAAENTCAYAKEHCNNHDVLPFVHYYFCQANENWLGLFVFSIVFVLVDFHFLSNNADKHLAPSLTYIAQYFKLSQTLAGATLIAFANGAPDTMAVFVATGSEEGILLGVGSIFGAGLLVTTCVLGRVIHLSGDLQADKIAITRDLIFNISGTSIIIVFAYVGYINYIMSAMFISIYALYIIVVLYNEKQSEDSQKRHDENDQQYHDNQRAKQHKRDEIARALSERLEDARRRNADRLKNSSLKESEAIKEDDESTPFIHKSKSTIILGGKDVLINVNSQAPTATNHRSKVENQVVKPKTWADKNLLERLYYLYSQPMKLIRGGTIPAANPSQWNKSQAIINCILTPVALLLLTENLFRTAFGVYIIFYFWLVTIPLAVCIWLWCEQDRPPSTIILFSFFGALMGILWTKLCVEMLVDLLKLIHLLTGISYAYIGMTFLAIGNSAGDFLVNSQVARLGFGVMAMSGCFSGVLFNMYFGLGLGLVRLTWIDNFKGTISFNLFRDSGVVPTDRIEYYKYMDVRINNTIAYTLILFALINIIVTFVIFRTKNYRVKSSTALYYYTFYIIFFLVITTIYFTISAIVQYLRPIS